MRILYFSFVELDVPNACQTHTLGVLQGFSRNGCQVDALVPRPRYVRPGILNVAFYYLWPWRFSPLGRIWVKILLGTAMFFLCMIKDYDAIYVREMQSNPGPRLCSKWFQIPLYVEINDIIPEYLKTAGEADEVIRQAARNQEKDFRQASGMIVNSIPMGNWIKNRYPSVSSKVHFIINGTESTKSLKTSRNNALRGLKLPEQGFYIGFLGTVYDRFDFLTVLRSIRYLVPHIPEIRFVIVGDGPGSGQLKSDVHHMQLQQRVLFTGYIDSQCLHNYLPAFDMAIIPLTRHSINLYGSIPTKFATYASFNLPVITTGSDLDGYPRELTEGVIMVPPENHQALADMLLWLYNHPGERKRKAKMLHDFVIEKLSWDSVTREIMDVICHDEQR